MIKVSYNKEHNAIVIEFIGEVDAAQGEQQILDIKKAIPKDKKGFTLLVDLTLVEKMDPKVKGSIKKAMDLLNVNGVTKIFRVIPNPEKDIGLNIMSFFHYSPTVKIVTLPSRKDAQALLKSEKGDYV